VYIARKDVHGSIGSNLIEFCRMINPRGQLFHANHLMELAQNIEKTDIEPMKIIVLIQKAYHLAVGEHLVTNPGEALPRQITAQYHAEDKALVIQYKTFNHLMAFRLRLTYSKCSGRHGVLVALSNDLARISRAATVNKMLPIQSWPTEQSIPANMRPVMVPLGEIIDLIQKYSKL
jgi:hypothetical protein